MVKGKNWKYKIKHLILKSFPELSPKKKLAKIIVVVIQAKGTHKIPLKSVKASKRIFKTFIKSQLIASIAPKGIS